MEIVFLLIGLVVGALVGFLLKKGQQTGVIDNEEMVLLRKQLMETSNEMSAVTRSNQMLQSDKNDLSAKLNDSHAHVLKLNNELTAAMSAEKNIEQRLAEQKGEMEQLNQRFKVEFENLAAKILEEKSQKFTEQNKQSLDTILNPLKEKIKDFEDKVQKVYDTEAAERNMLKGEIKQLMSLNQLMHQDAQNLTKALKGDAKMQGNWGEFILESILEKSGLVKDREYIAQASISTEDGKRFQPDILINLPDGKCLVIDSKVSLVAYERYVSADDEMVKALSLKEHLQSVRSHIKGLSDKNYQNLYGAKSLDFVLLFVPIESAFALSVQNDAQLFNDAFERNIVIVSPSTLLATLRTVANIWRQENQNKNAIDIANKAGDMYDKFVGFVDDLIGLGNKMRDSQKAYEAAMNKLHQGTGNLVKRSEDLKKLGAKATKAIPQTLIDRSELE
ncbi:DNA polymerase V [Bacteroidetes bacterium UKL13-3]|jgi:DNA recombination protein RmuC|nr:DNA polymerase V [Bacteroidetes bacterium UKL13-3]HCP93623.1 DNA recombination protein RmuC [Bacteroidota bacterium]